MKRLFLSVLNALGYELRKYTKRNKYRVKSDVGYLNKFKTPTGTYYLPKIETDAIVETMRKGLIFEPEIIDMCRKYIEKDSIVIDCGANCGQMTKMFASICKEVHSFEPNLLINQCLKLNTEHCGNVKTYHYALGDTKEILKFENFNPDENYSYGELGISTNDGVNVVCTTIDDLEIPANFIKIDAQGYDLKVMRGAINTILFYHPVILFEYCEKLSRKFGICFQDYVDFVDSIGYEFKENYDINFIIAPKG